MSIETDSLPSSHENTKRVQEDPVTESPTQDATSNKKISSTTDSFSPDAVGRKSLLEMEEEQEEKDDTHAGARNPNMTSNENEEREQPAVASPKPFMHFRTPFGDHSEDWEKYYQKESVFCPNGAFPLCQGQIEEQLDLITRCRNPMEVFSLFHHPHDGHGEGVVEIPRHIHGAYVIPPTCEYCGAETTENCKSDCGRPRSFFRRQRPPFCPPGPQWDAKTEYEIEEEDDKDKTADTSNSWMSGFFAGVGNGNQ